MITSQLWYIRLSELPVSFILIYFFEQAFAELATFIVSSLLDESQGMFGVAISEAIVVISRGMLS